MLSARLFICGWRAKHSSARTSAVVTLESGTTERLECSSQCLTGHLFIPALAQHTSSPLNVLSMRESPNKRSLALRCSSCWHSESSAELYSIAAIAHIEALEEVSADDIASDKYPRKAWLLSV